MDTNHRARNSIGGRHRYKDNMVNASPYYDVKPFETSSPIISTDLTPLQTQYFTIPGLPGLFSPSSYLGSPVNEIQFYDRFTGQEIGKPIVNSLIANPGDVITGTVYNNGTIEVGLIGTQANIDRVIALINESQVKK